MESQPDFFPGTLSTQQIINDDCLNAMKQMDDNSIDFITTDPPYGLTRKSGKGGFMGKEWDSETPTIDIWKQCLRICKPGSMIAVFGGSRTHHRLMCAIEDAGFEIRDVIMWIFGQGFSKGLNVGKHVEGFEGYHTNLKPAYEPIILAMKPCDGTFANNAKEWGISGINIDECRVGTHGGCKRSHQSPYPKNDDGTENRDKNWARTGHTSVLINKGRFPANLILDEQSAEMLDQQTDNASRFFKTVKSECNCSLCSCVITLKHDIMNEKGLSCETVNIAKNHLFHPIQTKNKDSVLDHAQQNKQQEIEDKKESLNSNAHAANQHLKTLPEINQNSVQSIALTSLEESIFLHVKHAENVCDLCACNIAQSLVKIKNSDFKIEELQATLAYIGNFKKCILIQNLVLFAEQWENIDIIPTTQSLSKLFGCVLHAIESYTNQENPNQNGKSEQSPFRYCPKASPSERNKGLEDFKSRHPTVKPISLMKYILKLLAPPGNPICVDPFMGSGTTGIACKQLKINFIGIEKELEYFEIAKKRIENN